MKDRRRKAREERLRVCGLVLGGESVDSAMKRLCVMSRAFGFLF